MMGTSLLWVHTDSTPHMNIQGLITRAPEPQINQ